jgi:spore coat protein A
MTVTRRQALGVLGLGTAALTTGALWRAASQPVGSTGALLTSTAPLPRRFEIPLPIPSQAKVARRPDGVDRVELVAREADVEILPGRRTTVWGYDGTFPGPTVRSRSGHPLELELRNELSVPTVLHLHGGHTPPESDGYPTDFVLPRGVPEPRGMGPRGRSSTLTRTYRYPLEQPAATLWYHDHTMDFTGPNVYRGLAGLFVVEDAQVDALGLPTGDRDLPLVMADRSFGADGELLYPALFADQSRPGVERRFMGGVLGDVVLVNGAPWPVHDVAAARYRLRLLNASSARRYELVLDGVRSDQPFIQIGTDQGLLDRPRPRSSVTMAQGERVEVVVDFGGLPLGTRVTLRDRLDPDVVGGIMQFVVARRAASDDTRVPERLGDLLPIDPTEATLTRSFHFSLLAGDPHPGAGGAGHDRLEHRWTVNGVTFGSGEDVARPALGAVERWRFTSDVHHPVHVHLLRMQVIGGDSGWKDTVDLRPGEAVEVLTRVEGFRGRYVMHCHNLEHEDMAMMANFTIV